MKKCFTALFFCLIFLISFSFGCKNEIDYQSIINKVTMQTMKANVTVNLVYTDKFSDKTVVSEGSGVIIKSEEKESFFGEISYFHYVLTNFHVIDIPFDYQIYNNDRFTYVIHDYMGDILSDEHSAELIDYDEINDLALLKFSSDNKLFEIEMSDTLLNKEDLVIAVGQPKGQPNAITVGKFLGMEKLKSDKISFDFEVITHDAYVQEGSSGGMLLDKNCKLVGINFAGSKDENENYVCGYALPQNIIVEFINKNLNKNG